MQHEMSELVEKMSKQMERDMILAYIEVPSIESIVAVAIACLQGEYENED